MTNHQVKKMSTGDLKVFRDRLDLPISDAAIDEGVASGLPPYYHPGADSDEVRYVLDRRRTLGGFVPDRRVTSTVLPLPGASMYASLREGSGSHPVATTMAIVRLLKDLVKDAEIGHRFVPIVPDEGRTFGMDPLFSTHKIYSPSGQTYESVDRSLLLSWKESRRGRIIHEGIGKAGSMASATAVGTAYATHGERLIPVNIFYSMFNLQRTGDAAWAFSDQMGRGVLLGATAGRTTLNGEGLQHAEGHSSLLAATNPTCISYDPAFPFEIAHIGREGLRRMYGGQPENVWYHLTVDHEPYPQPTEPAEVDVACLLQGSYRYAAGPLKSPSVARAQLLASGVAVPWALRAQRLLADEWGVSVDVWSAPSWTELRREAFECEAWNRTHLREAQRVPFVTRTLGLATRCARCLTKPGRGLRDAGPPWVQTGSAARIPGSPFAVGLGWTRSQWWSPPSPSWLQPVSST